MATKPVHNGRTTRKPDDDELVIDLDDLRVREIEELEEITKLPFDELIVEGKPKGKTLRAIGYIVKRRTNPNFTMEQAGELRIVLTDTDPTPAANRPSRRSATSSPATRSTPSAT